LGWAFNAYVQKHLRSRLKDSTTGAGDFIMNDANTLASYPVEVTSQMNGTPAAYGSPTVAGDMLFGDFSQVILAFWGDAGADILVSAHPETHNHLMHKEKLL